MLMNPMSSVLSQWWKDGQPCDAISPNDRAFLYGDGFFSSMRVSAGQIELWSHHLDRIDDARQRLGLQIDMSQLDFWLKAQAAQMQWGAIKLLISRGVGPRGYLPPTQAASCYWQILPEAIPHDISVSVIHCTPPIQSGLLSGCLGHSPPVLVGLKTLNRLEQVLLRRELAQTDWPEALVCDLDDWIIEGVQSNCWLYLNGQWQTPSLHRAGIAGVMRAELLARMKKRSVSMAITQIHRDQLDQVEALFFCNALTGIRPVQALNGRVLSLERVDSLLADLLS
jgi:4-amino-4-deoxychorismate lyase